MQSTLNNEIIFIYLSFIFSQESYISTRTKWYSEIHHVCSETPLLLVGTKTDLRNPNQKSWITFTGRNKISRDIQREISLGDSKTNEIGTQSSQLIKHIYKRDVKSVFKKLKNVEKYVECSSQKGENVAEVFEEAARAVLIQRLVIDKNRTKSPRCKTCF